MTFELDIRAASESTTFQTLALRCLLKGYARIYVGVITNTYAFLFKHSFLSNTNNDNAYKVVTTALQCLTS
jgi:hypothetical protein